MQPAAEPGMSGSAVQTAPSPQWLSSVQALVQY
jgi:hypothetical protein